MKFSEYTPEERKEWLEIGQTKAFLAELQELSASYMMAAVRGLAAGYGDNQPRIDAASHVVLDRIISMAKDVI